MQRNMYDTDVTVWSPQGRLLQVEYAGEAVKQGSATLGLTSNTHVVLAALKRSPHELASFQKKLLKIDDHIGVAIAGLNADARTLAKYMRTECLNHKYVYGAPLQASRLLTDVADKHQRCTQMYVRRPYGVGLLVAAMGKVDAFEARPVGAPSSPHAASCCAWETCSTSLRDRSRDKRCTRWWTRRRYAACSPPPSPRASFMSSTMSMIFSTFTCCSLISLRVRFSLSLSFLARCLMSSRAGSTLM